MNQNVLCITKTFSFQLETLKNQVGAETFDRLVQSTDPETLQQIREYVPLWTLSYVAMYLNNWLLDTLTIFRFKIKNDLC